MARNRTRLPWSRGATQAADASFFDRDPWQGPRPDSPEVSVFTPEEEAESHKRWKRAVLRERFSGPVSDAERLGFGLSAAALAALAVPEGEADADGEAEARWREGADPEGAGEVFAALKSASLGQAANKPPVSAKPAGAAVADFLDTDEDNAFSNPVSSRSDNGFGVRRATAPRGGGAPLEGRPGGGAERVEVTVLRKAEQATGDARAPLPTESAASAAAIRGPATADAQAVTMAIAMASELPEVREDRPQAEAKGANGGGAARANQAQALVDAALAKAKDAPPAAEAKADGRQSSAVEAAVRDKAGDAPSPAAAAKASAADAGRGVAAEAPGRAKANDDASGTVAAAEGGSDRKGSTAAEAPVEAKAKDVAPTAEAEGGLGQKAAKPLAQAKAAEVVVLETKSTGPEKGATDAHGATKAKDTQVVVEAKAEAVRQTVETPEQTAAKAMPDVAGTDTVHVNGSISVSAISQAKATSAADKASPAAAHAPAEAAAQAAKAAAVAAAPATADKAAPAAPHAPAEAAGQATKAEATNATAAEKSGAAHTPAEAAAQATKAAVLPATAADKAAAPAVAHGPAEATAQAAKAVDASLAVGAEKVAAAKGEAALQPTTPKDAEKSGAAHAPAESAGQATKAEATNAAAADKASPAAAHGPTETAVPAAKAAAVAAAPATADKAAPAAPHAQAEAAGQAAKAADAPPAVGAEKVAAAKDAGIVGAKADPGHGTVAAPGQAKDIVPSAAPQTDAGRDHAEAPGQAKAAEVVTGAKAVQVLGAPVEAPTNQANAKDAPAAGAKPAPSPASAEAPPHTAPKDALPAAADTAKAGVGLGVPEAAKQATKAADTIPAVAESKGAQDLGGHSDVPAVLVKVKDVAADAPAPAQHQAEPPTSAKGAPVAVTAAIVPEAAKAEQAAHVADTGAPNAEQAAPPVEQPSQAKPADPPPAQAHDTAQHDSAQHADATAGAVPTVSPTADTINLHVTDLWPGTGQQPGQSQNNVPHPEKAAQPVPHATDLVGANGEHGTSTVASADEGSSGGSGGGAAAVSPSLVTGEKNTAAVTSTVAPDSAKGTGDASPTQKAATTEPAGTEKHVAVTKPLGETADNVVSDTVTQLEKTSGHGLTEAEAFALLSAANPKAADTGHDGLTAGDILVQGHSDLNVSALDAAWHNHFATHDAVLL